MLASGLAPALKAHGFRRRARVFHRQLGTHWQVVAVHGGTSTSIGPASGRVANYGVELGVCFPAAYHITHTRPLTRPTIHDCQVAGGLPVDGWGAFDDLRDDIPSVEEQASALRRAWEGHGPAWFERLGTLEAALTESWRRAEDLGEWTSVFALAVIVGDPGTTREIVARCRSTLGGEALAHIDRLAAEHGVE